MQIPNMYVYTHVRASASRPRDFVQAKLNEESKAQNEVVCHDQDCYDGLCVGVDRCDGSPRRCCGDVIAHFPLLFFLPFPILRCPARIAHYVRLRLCLFWGHYCGSFFFRNFKFFIYTFIFIYDASGGGGLFLSDIPIYCSGTPAPSLGLQSNFQNVCQSFLATSSYIYIYRRSLETEGSRLQTW